MGGGPEYLDMGGGRPIQPPKPGAGRRTAVVVGGIVGAVVLAGAGAWAWSFFSTGEQPAVALPDSTFAYASVDLDPSGGQKIEALKTLVKFPALKEQAGLDATDDVRRKIVDNLLLGPTCNGLDFA